MRCGQRETRGTRRVTYQNPGTTGSAKLGGMAVNKPGNSSGVHQGCF